MSRHGCNLTLATLRGQEQWRVRFESIPGKYGEVDWSRNLISLDPRQSIPELVDSVIHEIAHVASADALSEELIGHLASGATAALLRLQLIRTEDD